MANLDAVETEIRTQSGPEGQRAGQPRLAADRAAGREYALEDLLAGGDRPAVNFASLRLSQGLPFLGGTGNRNATAGPAERAGRLHQGRRRAVAHPDAVRAVGGASVALRARVLGQGSRHVLPPAEKFFLGGSEINRGFYSGQVTGDNALAWSFELQLNTGSTSRLFGTR